MGASPSRAALCMSRGEDRAPGEAQANADPDHDLISRCQEGSFDAFEELVRRYRNRVFALAFHYVRNREDAWDLSQEVFVKAHRGLERFRGDACFKTWLMRITANQCKDHLKKRRLKTVPLEEDWAGSTATATATAPDPERAASARETGEAIQEALGRLSHKHRTAFILREFEGLSYEEMADVMKCSPGTVMSRLHHARKNLQSQLRRMGVLEESGHE